MKGKNNDVFESCCLRLTLSEEKVFNIWMYYHSFIGFINWKDYILISTLIGFSSI